MSVRRRLISMQYYEGPLGPVISLEKNHFVLLYNSVLRFFIFLPQNLVKNYGISGSVEGPVSPLVGRATGEGVPDTQLAFVTVEGRLPAAGGNVPDLSNTLWGTS